jgi:hypothetical protein
VRVAVSAASARSTSSELCPPSRVGRPASWASGQPSVESEMNSACRLAKRQKARSRPLSVRVRHLQHHGRRLEVRLDTELTDALDETPHLLRGFRPH